MTIGDALDFVSFFAFKCNGTTLLAEMHRIIMKQTSFYLRKLRKFKTFYEFLCGLAKHLFPGVAVGSCTDSRCQYSGGTNTTIWSNHQKDLLLLCRKFYEDPMTVKSSEKMKRVCREVSYELISAKNPKTKKIKFKGVGAMGAQHFLHIASAIGLTPLYCLTFAEITDDTLGPAKFIRASLSTDKKSMNTSRCNEMLIEIHRDLIKIWGMLITLGLIENMLCELSRSYNHTLKKMKLKDTDTRPPVDIIMDRSKMFEGTKNDICFYDDRRGRIQNFFALRTNGLNASLLRPVLLIRDASTWENGKTSTSVLTNWCNNEKDATHLVWMEVPLRRKMDTSLEISEHVHKMYDLKTN